MTVEETKKRMMEFLFDDEGWEERRKAHTALGRIDKKSAMMVADVMLENSPLLNVIQTCDISMRESESIIDAATLCYLRGYRQGFDYGFGARKEIDRLNAEEAAMKGKTEEKPEGACLAPCKEEKRDAPRAESRVPKVTMREPQSRGWKRR